MRDISLLLYVIQVDLNLSIQALEHGEMQLHCVLTPLKGVNEYPLLKVHKCMVNTLPKQCTTTMQDIFNRVHNQYVN